MKILDTTVERASGVAGWVTLIWALIYIGTNTEEGWVNAFFTVFAVLPALFIYGTGYAVATVLLMVAFDVEDSPATRVKNEQARARAEAKRAEEERLDRRRVVAWYTKPGDQTRWMGFIDLDHIPPGTRLLSYSDPATGKWTEGGEELMLSFVLQRMRSSDLPEMRGLAGAYDDAQAQRGSR